MSTTAGDRIYPLVLPPQVTLPAVAYQRITTVRDRVLSGFNGYQSNRFQFTSWAERYEDTRYLADEIITALEDYSGTIGGTTIQAIAVAGEVDLYEPESKRYGIATDFMITYS